MITLRSDNRTLVLNSKSSYLVDNYASGSASIFVTNTDGIATDSFILIGEMGQETSEIFRCGIVDDTTGEIDLLTENAVPTTSRHAHPESTRVYVIPYNQVRFYWTAADGTINDENPNFDTVNPLSSWLPIDPSSWYTTYEDASHATGFGWFVYTNTVTMVSSQESNPIPYAGFSYNTVASIFEDFDSMLNVNELKLVSISDKFAWLNEGLALLKNKLNLTNTEYLLEPSDITLVSGSQEYILPDDFSDMAEIVDSDSVKVPFMNVKDAFTYTGTVRYYYLRNRYIGIAPVPTEDGEVLSFLYRTKSVAVSSLSTYIDLPDNAFYSIKDWMMYRACLKFQNPLAETYYTSFTNSVNLYVQSSVKRDSDLDSWGIAGYANV